MQVCDRTRHTHEDEGEDVCGRRELRCPEAVLDFLEGFSCEP